MARNYMNEIANMGFGGGGASGYYSNMNRQYPGVGSMLQQGQRAGNVKYLSSTANNLAKGNIKEAAKSGIGYALNQNPYIAGINAFNQMTGGIRFDKMLGMGPKKPRPTAAQQKAELDYQTMLEADRNRYLSGATRAADSAQRYEEFLNAERNAIRELEQNGPSARSLAPMLGQFAAQNYASEGAARSNTAANLSRRGISPTSGLAIGAESAVDTGLAATRGQQSSAVMNQVMDMLQQRRQAMLGVDAAARKSALDREESMMDTASTLGLKGRELDMAERRMNELRDQQMFDRRQSEQKALGQFAGQFGPGLLNELQRVRDRNNPYLGTTKATTDQIVADFAKADRMAGIQPAADGGAGLIEQDPNFNNLPFTNLAGRQGVTYDEYGIYGPSQNRTSYGPQSDIATRGSLPIDLQGVGDFGSLMSIGDFSPNGRLGNINLAGNSVMSDNYSQTPQDVMANIGRFNPYALDGQIVEYQGQFYRKTPNGWEQVG
jgi:hypothetical protein